MKEIRRALLEADVNYNVARDFTRRVREEAMGPKVLTSIKPGEMMVKIVHTELTKLMGGEAVELELKE